MKKFFNFLLDAKWSIAAIMMVSLVMISSCKKEEEDPDNPIAAFQYTIGTDNFLEVTFDNYSQNATSYNWDFGDGNTSTEDSPVHTYAGAGTYTVKLTATGAEGTTAATKSEDIIIDDPNEQLTFIAGTDGKKWYLDREGVALGIGPAPNDNQWWSFGGVTPHGDRPCILDDSYEFHKDGSLVVTTGGTVFVDSYTNGGWLDSEQCVSAEETDLLVGENGEDLSLYTQDATYSYTFDGPTNTIVTNGEGFYFGLPNKTNNGDMYVPVPSLEFFIFNTVDGDGIDSLHLAMINPANGDTWNFYLVHYENEADLPDIPTSLPAAGFNFAKDGLTVSFTNSSKNATSYSWDFGDGGSSTEENPVYTYGDYGDYEVTLTAMDDAGNSSTATQTVSISAVTFTPDVLFSAEGKVWKLDGAASYYVGDAIGAGNWWGGITEDDLEARACILDDEFIFFENGDFVFDSKGEVFAEGYMGGSDACTADGDLVAPYDGLGSGNHAFEIIEGGEFPQIKVIGNGAYIGFSKAFNGGEYNGSDAELAQETTYSVYDYSVSGDTETIIIGVDIAPPGWWNYRLVSVK